MLTFSSGIRVSPKRGNEASESKQIKVGPYHKYTSVLLVVNGQDPTLGFVLLHRHQFLSSEFVELELKTAPIGRARWNLVKIWDRFGFTVFLWSTLT